MNDPQKIKVAIFPLSGVKLERENLIGDHINLSGSSPKDIGFIPITDLYIDKHNPEAIKVACLKEGVLPSQEEETKLREQGVSAYSYDLVERALCTASSGKQLQAIGFVPELPKGFNIEGLKAGFKISNSKDIGIIHSEEACHWAGTFTKNKSRASCVDHNIELANQKIHALVCNSGNANACTGEEGKSNDLQIRNLLSQQVNIKAEQILTASTGKIGVQLEMDKFEATLKQSKILSTKSTSNVLDFAQSILTTDLRTKIYQSNNMLGFSKGSGMIAPNMATMLAFIITDARIKGLKEEKSQERMQSLLKEAVNATFNSISVDGDCSTNDMVLLLSNGLGKELSEDEFKLELKEICQELALKILEDGEGVTKIIQLDVTNAVSYSAAQSIGKTIINSSLVKTAIFGNDPNWGRIIMALGNSCHWLTEEGKKQELDLSKVSLKILDKAVYQQGTPTKYSSNDESRNQLSELMKKNRYIKISLDLGVNNGSSRVWGTDLSYEYVRINAEYFT